MSWLSFKRHWTCLVGGAVFCSMALFQGAGAEERPRVLSSEDGSKAKSSPSDQEGPLVSGRAVGEIVPSFYTRVITGPLMNRSVCYVCRNGERPVVMVFVRKLGPNVAPLFQQVDRLVDKYRAEGLRGFAVHVSENPTSAVSEVQTFSFDHKIGLPLAVSSLAVAEADCQNLHKDAFVTVVLYQNRRVVSRRAFRAGAISSSEVEEVVQSVRTLVGE